MEFAAPPDVPIYVGDGFSASPSWEIAVGLTRPPHGIAQTYGPDVWLASEFRPPTASEVARFVTSTIPAVPHAVVGVLPVDVEAVATLRAYLDRARRGDLDEGAGRAALKRLLIDASRRLVIEGNVETRQPTEEPPRQLTVSRTDDGDLRSPRVGLHVDHRTLTPLVDRMTAPNRVCVNLGPGSRWLIYIPYSVGYLMAQHEAIARGDLKGLLGAVASRVPVLRVHTGPGQAYLAPAEAIFHDASTLTSSEPTTKLPLLGRFRPRTPSS